MNAQQTTARLVDQRARRRATQLLIDLHKAEWTQLLAQERAFAEAEVAEIERAAAATGHEVTEPVRLKPGARLPGQAAVDRIDVARCPLCVASHDRGHTCPSCGTPPLDLVQSTSLAREVHRLSRAGTTVDIIAATLHLSPGRVRELLSMVPR